MGSLEDCATTPLPDKFNLLSLGDKNDQLDDSYTDTMRLIEMIEHFEKFNLYDVFYIVKTTEQANGSLKQENLKTPLCLVNDYGKISI